MELTITKQDTYKHVLATRHSWSLLITRLTLAVVLFPHGAQKFLGWFGGLGFEGTMAFFTETMGIPYFLGLLAIIAEFFGALALVIGFLSRIAAMGIGITMLVAMLTSHIQYGFFMNWYGTQLGEGIEYFLLAIGISIAISIGGGGAYSIDKGLYSHNE